jgi:hypothetical protein
MIGAAGRCSMPHKLREHQQISTAEGYQIRTHAHRLSQPQPVLWCSCALCAVCLQCVVCSVVWCLRRLTVTDTDTADSHSARRQAPGLLGRQSSPPTKRLPSPSGELTGQPGNPLAGTMRSRARAHSSLHAPAPQHSAPQPHRQPPAHGAQGCSRSHLPRLRCSGQSHMHPSRQPGCPRLHPTHALALWGCGPTELCPPSTNTYIQGETGCRHKCTAILSPPSSFAAPFRPLMRSDPHESNHCVNPRNLHAALTWMAELPTLQRISIDAKCTAAPTPGQPLC